MSAPRTLPVATPADDQLVVRRALASRTPFRLALRVHRVPAARALALTTAVRVVDRVHGHPTDAGALALPAHPARLTPTGVGLLGIADLAEAGPAPDVHLA